ncbi:DNA-directed RNA polymerase, omega subunit [Spirochaeta thermophila DSM 6578]|uniref:DNA-directed RNA polymerase subunit omega n=1 Tax=Winmispira thermophila (strain ATCC 700085 / DSM 6578 / Z-1203) TaxID=869211 RepID=G0GEW8_WINT7|nr:DNA-directed RNA polymerase subunit omega [Spirochaeta thermophila]AEJ61524.1 DNA-directed RNA polymerase, omega subunit [Spirochaeta thermophila DSM 6578]
MILPLEELINFDGNVYELTVAVVKRADQLAKLKDKEVQEAKFKIVSLALRQVLTHKVQYQLEDLSA